MGGGAAGVEAGVIAEVEAGEGVGNCDKLLVGNQYGDWSC